jgi:predicted thioredoxin/glutaredoxin
MQNWQLTCLEKLAETDPDAYRSYRQKSEEFLKEWPEEVIRARISPDRQYEAIGF